MSEWVVVVVYIRMYACVYMSSSCLRPSNLR